MTKNAEVILAIDVSSIQLEVLISNGQSVLLRKPFKNTRSGCQTLLKNAQKFNVTRCAVEATGGYEQPVVKCFHDSGIIVNILNPARVRNYASGIGIVAKTDRIDACVIERYAREVKPKPNFQVSKSQLLLKRLVTRRSSLKETITAEKNRTSTAEKEIVKSINRVIQYLEKEVKLIENSIDQLIEQDGELKEKVEIITRQRGIANITSCYLIGLIPELGYLNKQEVASLSGLAPFSRDSGKVKGKRYIKGGRFLARKSLYMPAWVAVQHDQKLKQVYEKLIVRGKPKKVAIVAIMRKMIITANKNLKLYYQQNEKIA
jgi:transposase